MDEGDPVRRKAIGMLVLTAALWALSFPVIDALPRVQGKLVAADSSWFFSSLCVAYRFAASSLILALAFLPSLRNLTRSEIVQGIGLGITGAGGSLLQVDGMAYTEPSTSAFLTQCYCLFIPLVVAARDRRRPSLSVIASCFLVMAGVAILSKPDWRSFHMGRGELETIGAAVLFAAYILWLERPRFAGNDPIRFSTVNFAVQSLVAFPIAAAIAPRPGDLIAAYRSPAALALLATLIVACTLGGYLLMARWQKHVTATQAGLIYCMEPVFVAALVPFLPGWISAWTGAGTRNQEIDLPMAFGGGLIVAANVLIVLAPRPAKPPAAAEAPSPLAEEVDS